MIAAMRIMARPAHPNTSCAWWRYLVRRLCPACLQGLLRRRASLGPLQMHQVHRLADASLLCST